VEVSNLISYRKVRDLTGLSPRVLNYRVQRGGVQAYINGHDRRQRMLDVRDVPKLTRIEPVTRAEPVVAA
jgi:hypothetical protein